MFAENPAQSWTLKPGAGEEEVLSTSFTQSCKPRIPHPTPMHCPPWTPGLGSISRPILWNLALALGEGGRRELAPWELLSLFPGPGKSGLARPGSFVAR